MTTSVKSNLLPPSLISNLQQKLISRNDVVEFKGNSCSINVEEPNEKPLVLITNGEGIDSPGLTFLVEALLQDRRFNVHVCALQSDQSASGHSMRVRENLAVSSVEISGATGYEVSDLSGALYSWSKPTLVISGINKGSSCSRKMALAAAREALICAIVSPCISLNWKQDASCETDLKDAASVCLPLIFAAIEDIQMGIFPKNCLLNIMRRSSLSWQGVSASRHLTAGHFLANQQKLDIKLAQLSRDASAAVLEKEPENVEEVVDFNALEDGFVPVTPVSLSSTLQSEIQTLVSIWKAVTIGMEE